MAKQCFWPNHRRIMNLSGVAVKPLMQKNEVAPADLILVYDELDLPWGTLRVRPKGRPAGHNGVIDVIEKIGTQEFPRIRLGVHPGHRFAIAARIICCRVLRGSKLKPWMRSSTSRPMQRNP